MTDEIEISVDAKALIGGGLGGLLTALPSIAPLILGPQAALLSSNANTFLGIGVAVAVASVLLSLEIGERVYVPSRSIYSGLAAFAILGVLGYSVVPVATALSPSQPTKISGDNLRVAELEVEGMTCPGCKLTVKNYLSSMDGVKKVSVSLSQRSVSVVYDSDAVTSKKIADSSVFKGVYSASISNDQRYHG